MGKSISCISGEDSFLIEQEMKTIINAHKDLTLDQLNSDIPLDDLQQRLIGSNLFSPSNMFIIKNPWFLKATLSDKDNVKLKSVLQETNHSPHHLIITNFTSLDLRKKTTKILKESSNFKQFSAFKDWDQNKVLEYIPPIAASFGKKVTREATWALEQINGHNLQEIKQNIHILATYIGNKETITDADVLSLSAPLSASTYKFSEAMKVRNVPEMVKRANIMLENGEEPIRFLGLIVSNLRLYLQLFAGRDSGLTVDALALKLKKNSYFLKKVWEPISKKYTYQDIKTFFSTFAALDLSIKSGKIKASYGLEHALLTFSK
jgi:DNA polymerase III subunit delta